MEDVDADADEDAFPVSRRGGIPGIRLRLLRRRDDGNYGGTVERCVSALSIRAFFLFSLSLSLFLSRTSLTNCIAQSEGEESWMTSEVNIAGRVCRACAHRIAL